MGQRVGKSARASQREYEERVRLSLDGLDTNIVCKVARRRDDALIVVQELPFLTPGTVALDPDGRRARITRVAIDSAEGAPKLVIELGYFTSGAYPIPTDDSAVQVEPTKDIVVPGPRRPRRDHTLGYEDLRLSDMLEGETSKEASPSQSVEVGNASLALRTPSRSTRFARAMEHLVRGVADAFRALRD